MAMMKCPECTGEMSDKASMCPKCGWKKKKTKWWLWIPLGAAVAFLGFGAITGNNPEAQGKARARDAIDLCWSDFKRKSLEPETQRLIAGTCEGMEATFRGKYGHAP